jgi:hypothetical protein
MLIASSQWDMMPFIQLLKYNVFDPLEVTPELIADVGTKNG